jgi:hypothetical protein
LKLKKVRVVPAVGIELSNALQGNNLLILVSDKTRKNAGNGELRYTAGTWQASPDALNL